MRKSLSFNFKATGVGSVPFLDVDNTCQRILEIFHDIPFWPQFVKRSSLEDMSIQASQGLPLLRLNHEKNAITVHAVENSETELVAFYEHFLAADMDYFAIGVDYATGLYRLVELIEESPQSYGSFIKGQIVGPITFAGSLKDSSGRSALYNGEITDTIVKGLAIKALWLIKKMSISGKRPILFMDEPYLSGFGSAFTPIRREIVIKLIGEVVEYLHSRSPALIGIHCCGNTDWSMIIETGVDIVNFDAFDYMDYFLLYRDEIVRFLEGGGTIAWGAVPTTSFSGKETLNDLKIQLEKGLNRLYEWGIKKGFVAERSLITPACGLGTLEPDKAERIMELLSSLSDIMSEPPR
ncbi:MAG: methionine synthase [Deltaproteobacteria bacterium]|nr:methionine synthase [Deltaproteobacteria bacterium]MBW2338945.1 methionine synthase [Deltaproteobacteria bacterium]